MLHVMYAVMEPRLLGLELGVKLYIHDEKVSIANCINLQQIWRVYRSAVKKINAY